jgi:Ser-tRNA(Ala) deacylase AlaX
MSTEKEKKNYYAPMHSAEHILNRTMVNMYGCERSENSHIERKKSKCDYKLLSQPSQEQIIEIQKKVNEIINKNLVISNSFMNFDQAEKLFKIRVTKEQNPQIRIVSIGDYDDCPCIGEHVTNTSEIGEFIIISSDFENSTFRIRFKVKNDSEN